MQSSWGITLVKGKNFENYLIIKDFPLFSLHLFLLDQRALRQTEAIEEEHDTQHTRYQELEVGILELIGIFREEEHERTMVPSGTVYYPHGGDEAHGTEDSDRWEVLDGIQPMVFQDSECRSIRQCQRRHIESHAEGITCHCGSASSANARSTR